MNMKDIKLQVMWTTTELQENLTVVFSFVTLTVLQASPQSHYTIALGIVNGWAGCTDLPVSCIHWPFVCQLSLVLN